MALQIPTVTVEDLRAFHAKHFPHAPQPTQFMHGVAPEASEAYYEEEEDDLGYYPDGVKRTLTDEQIAMFRHSEIQRIIRERRRRRDNNEPPEEEDEEGQVDEDPDVSVSESVRVQPATVLSQSSESGGIEKPTTQQWATSSARTKARNKRNRNKYKAKKKNMRLEREQARKDRDAEESDEWDPWHQAKGPDVQQDDTIDLDY